MYNYYSESVQQGIVPSWKHGPFIKKDLPFWMIQAQSSGTRWDESSLYFFFSNFIVERRQLFNNGYPEESEMGAKIFKLPFDFGRIDLSIRRQPMTFEKECDRCKLYFSYTPDEYMTKESCNYHWGKIVKSRYTCCSGIRGSSGCTLSPCHVWNGTVAGVNDALQGFKKTRKNIKNKKKIFALDCEMCYTEEGLELSRVALLGFDDGVIYDQFVRPRGEVLDYNTRFSGVTDVDLNGPNAKSFEEVQNDILNIVMEDSILVGHGLENDLRVLKMIHFKIIDTALLFPHQRGYPYKNSLKFLIANYLHKEIQTSSDGHSPIEDAMSCLELVHYKVISNYVYSG